MAVIQQRGDGDGDEDGDGDGDGNGDGDGDGDGGGAAEGPQDPNRGLWCNINLPELAPHSPRGRLTAPQGRVHSTPAGEGPQHPKGEAHNTSRGYPQHLKGGLTAPHGGA